MNGTEEILKNRDIKKIFSAEIRVRSILFGGKQSNLQIINWQDLFKILGVIVQIFCKIKLLGDKLIPVHSEESYIELDFSCNVLDDELYRNQLSSWFGCLLSKELLILQGNGMSIALTESLVCRGWYAPGIAPPSGEMYRRKKERKRLLSALYLTYGGSHQVLLGGPSVKGKCTQWPG